METPYGDLILMSLRTHRYLRLEPDGTVTGDGLGAEPDPADPVLLRWQVATGEGGGREGSQREEKKGIEGAGR